MFRHIVMFRIKDEYKQDIPSMIEGFYAMKGKIDGLLDLEAAADELGSERSYDLSLTCTFPDRAAYEAYEDAPAHQSVRKRMHEVRSASVSCDYTV